MIQYDEKDERKLARAGAAIVREREKANKAAKLQAAKDAKEENRKRAAKFI